MGAGVDVVNAIEIKNLYVEFPMPLVPWPTRVRLGGQPGAGTTAYKGLIFFDDFPGVYLNTTFTPALKFHFVFSQFDEDGPGCAHSTQGARDVGRCDGKALRSAVTGGNVLGYTRNAFDRGDDIVLSANVEVTPWKGLDLRPLWIWWSAKGAFLTTQGTNIDALFGAGGASQATAFASDQARREYHYLGLDARWRSGPWSLDPSFIYLIGTNELASGAIGGPGGSVKQQDVDSWLLDVRGGWRSGPLLIEGLFIWTPGNSAEDNLGNAVNVAGAGSTVVNRKPDTQNYFRPLLTGGAYGAGWTNFFGGGQVDYLRGMIGSAMGRGTAVSFDRYGLVVFGVRPSYALTTALTLNALGVAHFTDEQIDTHGTWAGATGLTPESGEPRAGKRGDTNYLGTEAALGLTWVFAPGLTFDTVGGYLFAGSGLDQCKFALTSGTCVQGRRDAKDAGTVAARVRFSF
jgi:hypothetical protein